MFKLLYHKLRAKRRAGFGIQSPFVFNFQKKILNTRKKDGNFFYEFQGEKDKSLRMILRMIRYYNLSEIANLSGRYLSDFERYGIYVDREIAPEKMYDLVITLDEFPAERKQFAELAFVVFLDTMKQNNHPKKKQFKFFLYMYHISLGIVYDNYTHEEYRLKL